MRRCINKIFILFTLVCIFTGILTGCTWREDVIPKKLGTQEGLWLYYKDNRSRTDGTEKQGILQTVEFAEKSYDKDSFKINKLIYLTDIKTIVFWLSVFDEVEKIEEEGNEDEEVGENEGESEEEAKKEKVETQILYRYSYREKTGQVLYTLPSELDINMYLSDSYLYVKAYNFGILFNTSLELIGEDFIDCTLNKDLLYRCTKKSKDKTRSTEEWMLEWYQNGVWKSAWLDHTRDDESYEFYYAGDYLYAFWRNTYYQQYINLKTGEQTRGSGWEETHFFNGKFFILDKPDTGNPTRPYTLHLVTGTELTPVYTFKPKSYRDIIAYYSDADYIYLELEDYSARDTYYKLDKRTNEIQSSKQIKETDRHYFEITVGGYTFYQNERHYSNYIFGENCVYLYREKDGKKEAMQYKLSENIDGYVGETYNVHSRLFYNDICEF